MRKKNKKKGKRPQKQPKQPPQPKIKGNFQGLPPSFHQTCQDKFADFKEKMAQHEEWAETLWEGDKPGDFHLNPILVYHPNVFAADEVVKNIDLEIKDPVLEWWEEWLTPEQRVEEYLKNVQKHTRIEDGNNLEYIARKLRRYA